MNRIRTVLVAMACLLSMASHAQWQWLDKDGRNVFSDRAPPPDVPLKNILKRPGNVVGIVAAQAPESPARTASAPVAGASDASSDLAVPKLSAVDKDLLEKKRLADAAAAAKAKVDADRLAKEKSDSCATARTNKSLMDSGVRVSITTNDKGERVVLDDAGRAAEQKRIQTVIDATCR